MKIEDHFFRADGTRIEGYLLPNGVLLRPLPHDGVDFWFFYNETYEALFCVARSNSNKTLGKVFCSGEDYFGEKDGPRLNADMFACSGYVDCTLPNGQLDKWKCVFIVASKDHYLPFRMNVLVHESFHAMEFLLDHISETKRGEEQQAYLVMWIFDQCVRLLPGASQMLYAKDEGWKPLALQPPSPEPNETESKA